LSIKLFDEGNLGAAMSNNGNTQELVVVKTGYVIMRFVQF
jgi:hypothetical protein